MLSQNPYWPSVSTAQAAQGAGRVFLHKTICLEVRCHLGVKTSQKRSQATQSVRVFFFLSWRRHWGKMARRESCSCGAHSCWPEETTAHALTNGHPWCDVYVCAWAIHVGGWTRMACVLTAQGGTFLLTSYRVEWNQFWTQSQNAWLLGSPSPYWPGLRQAP